MDRIHWVTGECFHAMHGLARRASEHAPRLLSERLRDLLGRAVRRARDAGYSESDTRLIVYALAALADEIVMSAGGECRELWSTQSLQLLLFHENVAGERFFENLERVRREPSRIDVLRTYYLCLLFGFRGHHAVQEDHAALSALVEDVQGDLLAVLDMPQQLMPRSERVAGVAEAPRFSRASRVALGVLMSAIALFLGLSVVLRGELAQLRAIRATAEQR